METIVISCPECDKQIRAPADAVGKKIRCKSCEHVFLVKAPAKTPAPIKPAGPVAKPPKAEKPAKPATPPKPSKPIDDDEDSNPYRIAEFDEKPRCPQCAYVLAEGDVICLGCGFNLRTREPNRTRRIKDPTGEEKFFWLLPGILAVLGVILVIGYCFFHYFAWPGILIDGWDAIEDTYGGRIEALKKAENIPLWKGALIHPALFVFIVVPSLFASFRLGRFAVQRLILHPTPPEVEVDDSDS
ncbi:MAG: hypothetical protein HYS12_10010 [Planctomycetes bacterium]|nr:hypothetical protein [Planctomycetota bacterium]